MTPSYDEEDEGIVGPFLLVVDRSRSMGSPPEVDGETTGSRPTPIDVLNRGLRRVIFSLRADPEAAEVACLGMISFSTEAHEEFAIQPLENAPEARMLEASGTTNYAAAFELAKRVIERDVPRLGAKGYRPVVFFITDGKPYHPQAPNWRAALSALSDSSFALRPKIVVFGFDAASREVLDEVASDRSLVRLWDDAATDEVMHEILSVIQRTVVTLTDPGEAEKAAKGDDIVSDIVNHSFDFEPANYVIEYSRSGAV